MPSSAAPEAKYCSDACRRHRVDATDRALEAAIDALLDARAASATICPSDAARRVSPDDWRPLMEPARRAARRMVARGEAEITQGGSVVDPSTAKGPIRIRRPR
jgi:sarcosine oxidase gamma subunit